MIHGSWKDAIIAQNDSPAVSGVVDLARQYETMLVVIPLIDTAQVTIQVAEKIAGPFQEVYVTSPADGGNKNIISASGEGEKTWVVPIGGFQYIIIKASATQTTATRTFRVCGVRS